jgi:hypothetical protein
MSLQVPFHFSKENRISKHMMAINLSFTYAWGGGKEIRKNNSSHSELSALK